MTPTQQDLYRADFYVWTQAQAELLRDRRLGELDLTDLIEEVEDFGGALRRSMRLRAMTIMQHLLELQHWPRTERRLPWRETVRRQCRELEIDLTPALRRDLADVLPELCVRTHHDAEASSRDHGEQEAADALPTDFPYMADQIIEDRVS